jgi:hypothetical protein
MQDLEKKCSDKNQVMAKLLQKINQNAHKQFLDAQVL